MLKIQIIENNFLNKWFWENIITTYKNKTRFTSPYTKIN